MSQPTKTDKASVLDTHVSPEPQEISNPPASYTYYHAGPLFTLADLHTNVLLSRAIRSVSQGKFVPVLPQDLEQRDLTPHSIRDTDLRALLSCDLALFNYEGAELDAGTVVEYMVAKMADVPCVILRTDFRGAGDQAGQGDSWNLMSSNWPRTVGVSVNAMVAYKEALAAAQAADESLGPVESVARQVVGALEKVLEQPPRLPRELRDSVYQWIAMMPGFKEGGDERNVKEMMEVCKGKLDRGLL